MDSCLRRNDTGNLDAVTLAVRHPVLALDLVWLLCVMCGYAKAKTDCKRKNVTIHAFYPPVAGFLSLFQGF
jgi:hypothetical protein